MNPVKIAVAPALLMVSCAAHALDSSPGDYAWLGDNAKVAVLYAQYQHARTFSADGAGEVPNSEFESALGIFRSVYYKSFGDMRMSFQFFVPFGGFPTAKVGGVNQPTAEGLGDLTLGSTFYPFASAEPTGTTLGLSLFVTTPTGNHDSSKVSMGGGGWAVTPQIGLIQGLGNNFYLNAIVDVAWRESVSDGGMKDSSEPATQVQTYLTYKFTPGTSFSVGYSGRFGGERSLGDVYTGTKTRNDQLRLFADTFVSPTLQVQGMIGHDIYAEGGFKSDAVIQVRLARLF
ncbi:transporter [Pseudomonas putida]|uniref:transporter n=1 Tax=Pseudomonas putida TaxID=303 RepID=UPI002DC05101|nr:transporter [Pseudomonas putida]WRW04758.1 transporter [Pseudomonas putida]